jgi:hypothetical protein
MLPREVKARAARQRGERSDTGDAFMPDPGEGPARIADDLAENLAEDFLLSATAGSDASDDTLAEVVPEEFGGPFIESPGSVEFATGTDESNPADATAEPLPRVMASEVRARRRG